MAESYTEMLASPRWQRRRLDILNRESFRCQWCGDDDTQLHIHHGYYENGKKPWEYEAESLFCLCKSCHSTATDLAKRIKRLVGLLHPGQLFLAIDCLARLVDDSDFAAQFFREVEALPPEMRQDSRAHGLFIPSHDLPSN